MKKGYRFIGNPNVRMKKSIDYESDGIKGGNSGKVRNGQGNNKQDMRNDKEMLGAMKKIVMVYKNTCKDDFTQTMCKMVLGLLENL